MTKDSNYKNSSIKIKCLVDMMGGKPSCNITTGYVSPTLTCGRASVNDIHIVCYKQKKVKVCE